MNIKVKGIVRYPHIGKPSSAKNADKLQYSIQVLVHKTDPQCAIISQSLNEVIANAHPNGTPKNFNTCWKDLAIEEPENAELQDYMSFKASVNVDQSVPPIVDMERKPVVNPAIDSQIVGQIAWVVGHISTYNKVQVGIKTYLNGVMLTMEVGAIPIEKLSTKPSIDELFSGIDDAGPTVPTAVPVTSSEPPLAPPPAPTVSAPPATPATPTTPYQMTEKAGMATRDNMLAAGWTDETLIPEGMMLPPNGIAPSYA